MLVTAQHSSCALSPQLSDNHGDLECRYPGTETQTRRGEERSLSLGPGPRGLLSTTIATQPALINGLPRERGDGIKSKM